MKILEKCKKFFREAPSNWPVKAACILIAVCLYIFYTLSIQDIKSFTIPLNVKAQNGFVISGNYQKNVKVTVKGKTEDIAVLRDADFNAYLDLNYLYKDGKYKIPVTIETSKNAMLLDTLQVSVSPEAVPLTVEEQISGWIKVEPLISGEPAHGYQIKKITATPEEIEITGPRSMVLNFKRIQTQPVSVKNAEVSFEQQVIPENLGLFLKAKNTEKISVEVEIGPVENIKKFDSIPLEFENIPEGMEVSVLPQTVSCSLGGKLLDLESFTAARGFAKVNLADIKDEGIYDLSVEYDVPSKLALQDCVKTVKIEVKKAVLKENGTDSENAAAPETVQEAEKTGANQ